MSLSSSKTSAEPRLETAGNRPAAEVTRREAFRAALRYLALGGIALGAGTLIAREAAAVARGDCPNPTTCDGCAAAARCQLPQAAAARRPPTR